MYQSEKLILASGSPRRSEILTAVGWSFDTMAADIDESVLPDEEPSAYVRRLAKGKVETVASRLAEGLVLGADTTVVIENEILGKPCDEDDARRMLRLLSGKWHEVLTGVALMRVGQDVLVEFERTRVKFAEMSEDEIGWYVDSGEPQGKAGAYGIQGKAALFIDAIEGDYLNIVGLPIRLVYEMVKKYSDPNVR